MASLRLCPRTKKEAIKVMHYVEVRMKIKKVEELDLDPRTNNDNQVKPLEETPHSDSVLRKGRSLGWETNFLTMTKAVSNWLSENTLPRIDSDFHCHKLAICKNAKPNAQRKRKIREERSRAIKQEVAKLMAA